MNSKNFECVDIDKINEWINEYKKANSETSQKKLLGFIFLAYTPLIRKTVYSFARRADDPYDDLYQVASVGLLKAVNSFDEKIGSSFSSYAAIKMVGEIKHYLRDKNTLIRAPRQIRELSYRIHKLTTELKEVFKEPPTDEQIAQALNLSNNQILEALDLERRTTPVSIDQLSFEDNIAKDIINEDVFLEHKEFLNEIENGIILKEAMYRLDDELQEIINMKFFEQYTQAQIAQKLNLTQMAVSRKLKKALNQLFIIVKNKGIENYE